MKIYKNTLTKRITGLGVVCMLSVLFLSSCLKNNNDYYVPPVAYLSFIQASPDEPPMDLYLNNNKVNQVGFNYGGTIDYFRAYTGTRTVNLYNQGGMAKIFSDTIHLNANVAYSLFLTNTAAHPSLFLLTDSLSKPAVGNASVRFVNVSPDAPAVDFAIKDSTALVSNKAFKGFSSFLPIQASKNYTFEVRQHGTNTVLATLTNVTLNSVVVYTVWFHGLAGSANTTDKLSIDIFTNAYYY
ncbi:MAG: hypothetical protein JWQ66_2552 [Mucilaginibacter sp.]|nr:hypothetical protein [Mucilaginibacter sp.]